MAIYLEKERPDFWQLAKNKDGSYVDPWGPRDCTTHTTSRLIMRHNEGVKPAGTTGVWPPNGYAIRRYSGDISGGTNHRQMADVADAKYKTSLGFRYNVDFDEVIDLVEETRGVGIAIWYKPIRDYAPRRGSLTFYQNHEIFLGGVDRDRGVFTDVVDPLADGRYAGIYKGPGEYPISLIRKAAGMLNVAKDPRDYNDLGVGLAYIIYTKPTGAAPGTPAPAPRPPAAIGVEDQIPMNILSASTVKALLTTTQTKVRLAAGTLIYDRPAGKVITKASKQMDVVLTGYPGTGWRTIMVSTSAATPGSPNPTGQQRTVEAYVVAGTAHPI